MTISVDKPVAPSLLMESRQERVLNLVAIEKNANRSTIPLDA